MKSFLERRASAVARLLGRFRDDAGNVAIIFGLLAVVLMLAVGAAIDMGRWLHARDQTVAAIDAGVLAGGRALQTSSGDEGAAVAAATKFYKQNVATRLPIVGTDSVTFKMAGNKQGITADGTAYIATPFLSFAGIEQLPLVTTSKTEFSGAGSQIGMKSGDTEIAVMLDVTGSMAGQKLTDLKDAAKDLVEVVTLANTQGTKYHTKVALIPFSEDIRLPTTTARNKARGTGLPACKQMKKSTGAFTNSCPTQSNQNEYTNYYLSDCVVERTGTAKYNDDAPTTNKYVMAHYTTQSTGSGSNKKGVCTVPASTAIQPLTDDKATLLSKINGLTAAGGTAGHLGTAWAWYTLSPNWNALWATANQAKPYPTAAEKEDKAAVTKVAILMTDGEYNTQYDSNGVAADANKTSNCSKSANKPDCSTQQARALCAAMKTLHSNGIEVYTIGFDVGGVNSTASQTLSQCASDPTKYYNADDGEELKQAYRDIAIKLTSLYLSK
jgi:Flp pilus assembly protein TadG